MDLAKEKGFADELLVTEWETRLWDTHHAVRDSLDDEWEEMGEVCGWYDELLVHVASLPDELVEFVIEDVAAAKLGLVDLGGADKRVRAGSGGGQAHPSKRVRRE